jgi:hypothetical protein
MGDRRRGSRIEALPGLIEVLVVVDHGVYRLQCGLNGHLREYGCVENIVMRRNSARMILRMS